MHLRCRFPLISVLVYSVSVNLVCETLPTYEESTELVLGIFAREKEKIADYVGKNKPPFKDLSTEMIFARGNCEFTSRALHSWITVNKVIPGASPSFEEWYFLTQPIEAYPVNFQAPSVL